MLQVELRDIHKEDLQKILFWRNQEFIRNVMFNNSLISWEQHLSWYEDILKNNNKISKIFCFENKDFGMLNIYNIDLISSKCDWGFYIGEKPSPKGLGLFLGYTSLEFIFSTLGIRKVSAEILESNIISRNFHEKLGFSLEGILRKHIQRDNKFEDVYLYSIFNDEWVKESEHIKMELGERF